MENFNPRGYMKFMYFGHHNGCILLIAIPESVGDLEEVTSLAAIANECGIFNLQREDWCLEIHRENTEDFQILKSRMISDIKTRKMPPKILPHHISISARTSSAAKRMPLPYRRAQKIG